MPLTQQSKYDLYDSVRNAGQEEASLAEKRHAGLLKAVLTGVQALPLVAVVLCLSTLAGYTASNAFVWRLEQPRESGLLPDSYFPRFSLLSTTFVNGGEFTRNDSHGDQLWDSLVPMGGGYVRVKNPRQYDLPPSEVLDDGTSEPSEMYQASVVHQLHCLGVLRNVMRTYWNGNSIQDNVHDHVGHCIEYLRQAVLCTADATLEQANEGGAFNAQGAVHQCREWSLVKKFLEDNRVDDAIPGILDT